MATRKRSRRSTRKVSPKRRPRPARPWLKWLASTLLLAALLIGGYSLHLAQTVRVKFEGKRWAVPARVYARPLELYEGASLTPARLEAELDLLGYRKQASAGHPGEWSNSKGRYVVRTRAFRFWDEELPSRQLDIRLDGQRVVSLNDAQSGTGLDLLRLEPVAIGSIYPAHKEDRVLVRRNDLPEHLVQALLAVEDRKFFDHAGVDPLAIARAAMANLGAGKAVQGGSTLTQQLVKNFFLTDERSLWRKINEAWMALILEADYSKDEILEAYANEIYLGQDGERAIHGFGLASLFYFNRPLTELRVQETALLVGLLKGASYYNPRRHPERALERRNLVLRLMAEQGFLDAASADRAAKQPLGVTKGGRRADAIHPAFMDLVRRQLHRDYREEDLTSEGLRIFTTLDPWMQKQAERQLAGGLAELEQRQRNRSGTLEGAVVLIGTQGGEVRALVGGRESGYAGFNRALDAVRPIGSLVKPAVYLAALSSGEGFSLVSWLEDSGIELKGEDGKPWRPENYDRREHGRVQLHEALTQSYNLATVHLGLKIGLSRVVQTLQALGIARPIQPFPSLLLGSLSLPPIEVAQMYQTIAAGGFRSPLRAIREVADAEGGQLRRYPLELTQTVKPGPAYLLTRNMVEVVRSGTAKGLARYLPRTELAGKTGTTNDMRDSWFAGFGGDLLGVVWVGRDDNQPAGLSGASGALTIWGSLMQQLQPASLELSPPEGMQYLWIDAETGQLSAEDCRGAQAFPFLPGTEPGSAVPCAQGRSFSDSLSDFLKDLLN